MLGHLGRNLVFKYMIYTCNCLIQIYCTLFEGIKEFRESLISLYQVQLWALHNTVYQTKGLFIYKYGTKL